MSDEPKQRIRGQKEREEAYKHGFLDGVQHGIAEVKRARELEEEREGAMGAGLMKFRRELSLEPKRTRRKKGTGVSMNPAVATAS